VLQKLFGLFNTRAQTTRSAFYKPYHNLTQMSVTTTGRVMYTEEAFDSGYKHRHREWLWGGTPPACLKLATVVESIKVI